ncbi:MAG: hypothetical protein CMN76_17830 [Spirochaetaceae bacterium]|nr:hypothetical protein [Spirochaetaceae bacterium]|tara:strand:- start:121767 stop:122102 length:336 start_codon:yes stop_codon:yes gene_type:complete
MEEGMGQGWTFWPYKRVASSMPENFRHLVKIQTGQNFEIVNRTLRNPRLMASEKEKVLAALHGFLESSRAENLVIDPEIHSALGLKGQADLLGGRESLQPSLTGIRFFNER